MKTKIIPFSLKEASDIQFGRIAGKIKTRNGHNVRIIGVGREGKDKQRKMAVINLDKVCVDTYSLDSTGCCNELIIEIPDMD